MAFLLIILYLQTIIFQPSTWTSLFYGIPLEEILILATLICLIPKMLSGSLIRLLKLTQTKCLISFLIVSTISVFGEGVMGYAIPVEGYQNIKFFLTYIIIVLALDSTTKIKYGFLAMLAGGATISYYCIRLFQTGVGASLENSSGYEEHVLNWRGATMWLGIFDGANSLAFLLVILLGMSIGFCVQKGSFFLRLYGLITTGYIFFNFYLTDSRGGFLGVVTMVIGYFYIFTKISIKKFAPIAIMLLVLLIAVKPTKEGRGVGESSTPERVELFHQSLQIFKQNPIIGIGVGQFAKNNPIHKQSHNIYLQKLAETGLTGTLFFILMFYASIQNLLKLIRTSKKNDEEYKTGTKMLITLAGSGVTAFFLSVVNVLPYVLIAFSTAVSFSNGVNHEITSKDIMKVFVIMLCFITLAYVAIQVFFIAFR